MAESGALSPFHEQLHAHVRDGQYDRVVDMIPFAKFLGLRVSEPEGEQGAPLCTMPFDERLVGNTMLPALHGGALGALLEATAIFELLMERPVLSVPKVVNITVEYLRSARPMDTHARGTVTKLGRRVAHVSVSAWQGDRSKPVAVAHSKFLVNA